MSTQCPYCFGKNIHVQWKEVGFWKCDSCGLYFRNPMPTLQQLDELYTHVWTDTSKPVVGMGGTGARLSKMYAQALTRDIGRQDLHGLKILDFGAGRGDFAVALRQMGADVICVEPFGYDYLVNQGFTVYRDLDDLPVDKKMDGIVTIDVWEHLTEPWKFMERCSQLLGPEGWLFIATANPLGLNARLRGTRWREARKPSHLLFPEPRTLDRMSKSSGFSSSRRLKWYIRYHERLLPAIPQFLMQLAGLDGELRYLAWKS